MSDTDNINNEVLGEQFLLLGAEGCAELGDPFPAWIRYAECDEYEEWKTQQLQAMGGISLGPDGLQKAAKRVSALTVDGTGRPYYLVVILSDAPADIWKLANEKLRVLRLRG